MIDGLLSNEGLSELKLAFEPGLKIGEETVCRNFQPSFVVTSGGELLVFCQGRVGDGWDDDMKIILMNRSWDLGKTWEGARPIFGAMNHFAISPYLSSSESEEIVSLLTCVDLNVTKQHYGHDYAAMKQSTGIDIEVVGRETPCVLCRFTSEDMGDTWQNEPLTGDKTPLGNLYPGGTPIFFNAIGQVHVIPQGSHQGRYILGGPIFVVPEGAKMTSNFRDYTNSGSAVIYSDDQGTSWKMDGLIADYLANEASAVSIDEGEDLLIVRRLNKKEMLLKNPATTCFRPKFGERIFHTSSDGGKTWSEPFSKEISGVECHGTMARVGNRIYFSVPQGYGLEVENSWECGRENGTIYFSDDEGKTWSHKVIEAGTFSYSTVGQLTGKYRITLFSRGLMGEDGIGYRIFTDDWLDTPTR